MSVREVHLCEPLLDSGIEDVAFWNGRVLAAEDLADQRDAHIDRARLVARAAGEGVAHGLMVRRVEGKPTFVHVGAGLAVNRRGDVLHLPVDVQLRLVPAAAKGPELGGFADCEDPGPGTYSGHGFYVLLVGPAEGTRDSAPAVTFESDGIVKQCGPKYEVDGVRFRLAHVDVAGSAQGAGHDGDDLEALTAVPGDADRARRRNVLAHVFLGTRAKARRIRDLYGSQAAIYGPLDELRAAGLVGTDEVPLAAISWVAGVEFADSWAVRRRLHQPLAAEDGVATLTASRARAEGEAAWFQFCDHVADLVQSPPSGGLGQLRARARFRYLPAAGCIPVGGGGRPGLDRGQFFHELTVRDETFMPGAALPRMLRAGFDVPPFDVTSGEALWLHQVSENAAAPGAGGNAQRFLAFARAHLPYEGNGRFDVGRFDGSNFALRSAAHDPRGDSCTT